MSNWHTYKKHRPTLMRRWQLGKPWGVFDQRKTSAWFYICACIFQAWERHIQTFESESPARVLEALESVVSILSFWPISLWAENAIFHCRHYYNLLFSVIKAFLKEILIWIGKKLLSAKMRHGGLRRTNSKQKNRDQRILRAQVLYNIKK